MNDLGCRAVDPVWEKKYSDGHAERYPWDSVVSFVFRNVPKCKAREDVRILEVGFGTGANLWFAAREGFKVAGVEASESAVRYAQKRFEDEGLVGDLRVGDFCELPFEDDLFDMVVDRGSLVCVGKTAQIKAVNEVNRVLCRGGRFLFNGYVDSHSSYRASDAGMDGLRININAGSLVGVGQLHFISRSEIDELFADGWKLHKVERRELTDLLNPHGDLHAEWLVVAGKVR